ncbi:MAG: hypothetical protein SPL61_05675 [Saccharofermentans sp.]|nr:hypothetical protein [Saccharofermentans sp.]
MIRIASFNAMNLSIATKDDASKKTRDLDEMARILRDCKSDIIVLQEILSPRIIEGFSLGNNNSTLTRRIGPSWRGKWVNLHTSSKNYKYTGDNRNEGYAFLWDTRRVELKRVDGKEILPKKYSHNESNKLLRAPGYGRFILRNRIRPVEIRVITAHIAYSNPKVKEEFDVPDIKEIQNRKREFDILSSKIYKNINDICKDPEEFNAIYTLILGDYNLNLQGSGATSAIIQSVNCYDRYGNHCYGIYDYDNAIGINVMKTVQSDPTTINKDCTGYASNYDHCTYNIELEKDGKIGRCYRKSVINDMSQEEIKRYRDTVSDHVPIVVELNC